MLLINDDAETAPILSRWLSRSPEVELVGEYSSARRITEFIDGVDADVVVLHVSDMELELALKMLHRTPARVVVLGEAESTITAAMQGQCRSAPLERNALFAAVCGTDHHDPSHRLAWLHGPHLG